MNLNFGSLNLNSHWFSFFINQPNLLLFFFFHPSPHLKTDVFRRVVVCTIGVINKIIYISFAFCSENGDYKVSEPERKKKKILYIQ